MDLNKSIFCVGSEYTGDHRVSDGDQTKPWFLTTGERVYCSLSGIPCPLLWVHWPPHPYPPPPLPQLFKQTEFVEYAIRWRGGGGHLNSVWEISWLLTTWEVTTMKRTSNWNYPPPPPLPSPLSNAGQWEQPSRGEGRIWTRVNFSILHLTVSDGCSRAIMGVGGGEKRNFTTGFDHGCTASGKILM